MFSLINKVAVVTGGSAGIGAAIVERFRAAGANVIIFDLRPDPEDPNSVRVDVGNATEFSSALRDVRRTRGRLDILVNNAGIQPLGVGFDTLTERCWPARWR